MWIFSSYDKDNYTNVLSGRLEFTQVHDASVSQTLLMCNFARYPKRFTQIRSDVIYALKVIRGRVKWTPIPLLTREFSNVDQFLFRIHDKQVSCS